MEYQKCYSCGLKTEPFEGPIHKYLGSSPGCWAKYGELLTREYQNMNYMKMHGLTVDAYALQHPGKESLQTISSAHVHLASLYSYFENGASLNELSGVKQYILRYKSHFMWLEPPQDMTEITVLSVLKASSAQEHENQVTRWARFIFDKWNKHHSRIAAFI